MAHASDPGRSFTSSKPTATRLRLLSVSREGAAYRSRVGRILRTMPQYKEVADFFTEELPVQLRDSKAQTTAKLDAPTNKRARLLNSPAMKRVLLNRSLSLLAVSKRGRFPEAHGASCLEVTR